jgi:hypothetical protein
LFHGAAGVHLAELVRATSLLRNMKAPSSGLRPPKGRRVTVVRWSANVTAEQRMASLEAIHLMF